MTPESAAFEACRARVAEGLRALYGDRVVVDERGPSYGVRVGSVWVNVWVRADESGAPTVTTRAWLVEGAELTAELLHHLLVDANRPPFGAFGLDSRDVVFVEHALPGEGATAAQIRASVASVAAFADRTDDAIVARFGGIRMTDKRPDGAGGSEP